MNGFWTPILDSVRRFLAAWGSTLFESAPEFLQPYMRWSRPSQEMLASNLMGATNRSIAVGTHVDVIIDNSTRLHYRFSVPKCAASELPRVVAMEAERILPVYSKKLVTAFQANNDPLSDGRVEIDLVAVRKSMISDLLASLRQKGGVLTSLKTKVGDQEDCIEFSLKDIVLRRYMKSLMAILLAIVAFVVGIQYTAAYLGRLEGEIATLEQKVSVARTATRQVAALQSQMRERRGLSVAVADLKRRNRMTLLLKTLTDASPDHVVLETFRVDRDRLQISGVAENPETWAIALEEQDAFEEVVLLSVQDLPASSGERFQIRLNVSWTNLWERQ